MVFKNPEIAVADGIITLDSTSVAVNYTPTTKDNLIFVTTGDTNDTTILLPAVEPANQGIRLFIKKVDAGTATVIINANTNGSTIDGSNTMVIADQYGGVEVVCGLDAWYCLSDGRAPKTAGFTGNLDCATASVGTFINGHLVSST